MPGEFKDDEIESMVEADFICKKGRVKSVPRAERNQYS